MKKIIAERLIQERLRLGLKKGEMASVGGVANSTYTNYEEGTRAPDSEFLAAIAAAGADVQYILTGKEGTTEISAEEQDLLNLYREDGQVREVLKNTIEVKKKTLDQLSNLTANDSKED